jgi:O-acetyl-ADP-ribose deacetylase (regulator of RNase III)
MITYAESGADLFAGTAEVLVNPVNARGVMGKGLALQFKTRYPAMEAEYRRACAANRLAPGGILSWRNPAGAPKYIVNLATKDSPFAPSQYSWVESGLKALRTWAERIGVASIATPALGAGLGGLEEDKVRALAERIFADSRVSLVWYGKLDRALEAASERRASQHADPSPVQTALLPTAAPANALFDRPAAMPPLPPQGEWHRNWFSNMLPYDAPRRTSDGLLSHTPEHDYQMGKCSDPVVRRLIADLGTHDRAGLPLPHEAISGYFAKRFWKEVAKGNGVVTIPAARLGWWGLPQSWLSDSSVKSPGFDGIVVRAKVRADWDLQVAQDLMLEIQRYRFQPGTSWANELVDTGRMEIVEFNNWNDRTWGRDIRSGEGRNLLGTIIMTVREELRRDREMAATRLESPPDVKTEPTDRRGLLQDRELSRVVVPSIRGTSSGLQADTVTLALREGPRGGDGLIVKKLIVVKGGSTGHESWSLAVAGEPGGLDPKAIVSGTGSFCVCAGGGGWASVSIEREHIIEAFASLGLLDRGMASEATERTATISQPLASPQTVAKSTVAPSFGAEYLEPGVPTPAGFVDAGALGPTKRSGTLLYMGKAYDPAHGYFFISEDVKEVFQRQVEELMGPLDRRNSFACANALALGKTPEEAVPFIVSSRAAWEKFADRMPAATMDGRGYSANDYQAVEDALGRPLTDVDIREIAIQAEKGLEPAQVALVLAHFDEVARPEKVDENAPIRLRVGRAETIRDEKRSTGRIVGLGDMGYMGRSKWVPDDLGMPWYHALRNQNPVSKYGGASGPAIVDFEADFVDALEDRRADSKAIQAGVERVIAQAEKNRAFIFVCHCAPAPCHCNVLLTYVGLELKRRGQAIDVLDVDRERAKEYREVRKLFSGRTEARSEGR